MSKLVLYCAALAAFGTILMAGAAQAAPSAWWAPYTPDANTLGLWHFNDVTGSTGTFADSSSNANTGTLNSNAGGGGFTLTVPTASGAGTGPGTGLFGTALEYDTTKNAQVVATGSDTTTGFAWGSVPSVTGLSAATSAMTIEAWIKPTADVLASNEQDLFGTENGATGWNFGLGGGMVYMDNINNGYHYAETAAGVLTADTWAHVAGVWTNDGTNSTITIYVNGAQAATTTYADDALGQRIGPLNFGNRGIDQKYVMYRGQMDEVRLSDVARTFGAAPVPEPASLSLLALGGLFALRRRRRVV